MWGFYYGALVRYFSRYRTRRPGWLPLTCLSCLKSPLFYVYKIPTATALHATVNYCVVLYGLRNSSR